MYLGSMGTYLSYPQTLVAPETNARRRSDGYPDNVPDSGSSSVFHFTDVDLTLTQHSPHLLDCRPTRTPLQERSRCHGIPGWNQRAVQVHRHHAHQVFRPLRCERVTGDHTVVCLKPSSKCVPTCPR